MPVLISSALAVGTFVFYVGVSSALQSFYYSRRPTEVALWKSQPNKVESLRESGKDKWWWPATELLVPHAQRKPGRHPMHPVFATVNTLLASLYMFVAAELTANGYSRIQWSWDEFSIASFVTSVVLACLWENVVEYYHHRIMHTRFFYTTMHKYHHYYKAPEPFDDMMVHPLEIILFYTFSLYTPPFIIPMHWTALAVYAGIMGLTGMLDHCGIKFSIAGLYKTTDHDLHHELYTVNYGFPFAFMDHLHGTAMGSKSE